MNVWESVKELQLLCEHLEFKHIQGGPKTGTRCFVRLNFIKC